MPTLATDRGHVVAYISPFAPWADPACTIEHAAQAVHIAVGDVYLALEQARTNADALAIQTIVAELVAVLAAVQDAALTRADQLCGHS